MYLLNENQHPKKTTPKCTIQTNKLMNINFHHVSWRAKKPLLHGTSPVEQPRSLTSGKYIPQVSSAKKVPDLPAANGDGLDGYGGYGSMSRWQSLEGCKIVVSKVVYLWKLGKHFFHFHASKSGTCASMQTVQWRPNCARKQLIKARRKVG